MAAEKRRAGLGRGLSALMEDVAAPTQAPQLLPIASIVANPRQPRRRFDPAALEELTESVRARGLLQPILVRPTGSGRYEIVAGERRWRAAQAAPLHEVPAIVRELDDGTALEIAIVENVQRADLNPIEEAASYRRLIDEFGHRQEDVARVAAKSRSHVANLLRLLDLPPPVRDMVVEGRLTMGHARALIGTPNPEALAHEVVARGLSVRQTEARAAQHAALPRSPGPRQTPQNKAKNSDPDLAALERQLADQLGLPVIIDHAQDGTGMLGIQYSSLDQLDFVCQRLSGGRV